MEKIILLHGALGSSGDLRALAAALQKRDMHADLFNFSGHGGKPLKEEYNVDALTEELLEYTALAGKEGSHLFGYSMGGYVALNMAAITAFGGSVFTLGTRLTWSPEFAEQEMKKLVAERMEEKIPAFAQKLKAAHGEQWKDLVKSTASLIGDLGRRNHLTGEKMKKIRGKVCLGIGDQDQMADASDTLRFSKIPEHGQMYMMPGTKHQVETADPDLLAEIICSVLKK